MLTIMDRNNIKDNILRLCYHQKNGIEMVELRNSLMNDSFMEEYCDELVKDGYLTKQNQLYKLTLKGKNFVLESSFSCPNKPIVYS
jgi:predicted transcriptional regulator